MMLSKNLHDNIVAKANAIGISEFVLITQNNTDTLVTEISHY